MMFARPIQLRYFLRIPNVGDRVNPDLIEALTGCPAVYSKRTNEPHLLAVGSILGGATQNSCVWGAGYMFPSTGLGGLTESRIWALRGKETYQEVKKSIPGLRDMPLGDPGMLAPELLGIAASRFPKYELGLVPHYVDQRDPRVLSLGVQDGVTVLDVHQEPATFLRHMAQCRVIASSSLHGLVFAEAMGLPNLWLRISNEIAGGDFKFRDWYSTTSSPQHAPYKLGPESKPSDLISRCAVRGSTIDRTALKAALSEERLEEVRECGVRHFYPVQLCRQRPMPCFLISYNRGDYLDPVIEALKNQDAEVEVIIHDNSSDDLETLGIIENLENSGIKVYRNPYLRDASDLNAVNTTVSEYFSNWAEPQQYIVSDCDIDMSIARPSALRLYSYLLNRFRKVEAVGPMLRIRDIPASYPLRNHAINRHIEQFWRRWPDAMESPFGQLAYIQCRIDTTLAVHRAGEPFRRLKQALRVYDPFEAKHLDWYLSVENQYTRTSNPEVSHWNTERALHSRKSEGLKFERFVIVRSLESGELDFSEVSAADIPMS